MVLYCGVNHALANKVFILQESAVRIICGVSPRTHCRPLFNKLVILTLTAMFVFDCLLNIKNNIHKYTFCSAIHNHQTRNSNNIYI